MTESSIEKKDIQKFGIASMSIFGLFCFIGCIRGKFLPAFLFGSLSVIGVCFSVMPFHMAPVYRRYLKATFILGRIMTAGLLILMFYFVICPFSFARRMFGWKILKKEDKNTETYWVVRSEPIQPKWRIGNRY